MICNYCGFSDNTRLTNTIKMCSRCKTSVYDYKSYGTCQWQGIVISELNASQKQIVIDFFREFEKLDRQSNFNATTFRDVIGPRYMQLRGLLSCYKVFNNEEMMRALEEIYRDKYHVPPPYISWTHFGDYLKSKGAYASSGTSYSSLKDMTHGHWKGAAYSPLSSTTWQLSEDGIQQTTEDLKIIKRQLGYQ
jgi:hypothetical protein